MPTNKFKIFDKNKNNTFNEGDSFTSFDNGFEPGDIVESKPVNTGLYQSTLITTAFLDALGDSSNIGYNTSYQDLVDFIKNHFTDLGGLIQSKSLNITTDAITLEWNKFFYKINKTVATENTITLAAIDDSIKNEITVMLTTNLVNTKIKFAGITSVYLINHGTTNVSNSGLVYNFQDKGTYILRFFAKNPSVVYMETSKGEYSATMYLNNPEITLKPMISSQGAYPHLNFTVKNPNSVEVVPTFTGDASGISATNIPAGQSKDYSGLVSKYEGSFTVSIKDPKGQVLGTPNASKSWSVTPTFSKPTISFSGSGTSRTLTITRVQGQGGATTSTDYKVWKSTDNEPSSYSNEVNPSLTQTLTNNTYEAIIYKVKARTKATYGGKTSYTEDITNQVSIQGQAKPTLKTPTITLLSQTSSQITFKVQNPNNVACDIYWKVADGSFQKHDNKVNPNSQIDCTIISSIRPTVLTVYLAATNYNNSSITTLDIITPTLSAPIISTQSYDYDYSYFIVTNNTGVTVSVYYKKGSESFSLKSTLDNGKSTTITVVSNSQRPIDYTIKFSADGYNDSFIVVNVPRLPQRELTKTVSVIDACSGIGNFKTCEAAIATSANSSLITEFSAALSGGSRNCCEGVENCVQSSGCPYIFKTISWQTRITENGVTYGYAYTKYGTGIGFSSATAIYLEEEY